MSKSFQIYNQYSNLIFDDSLYGVYSLHSSGYANHPWGSITSNIAIPPSSVEGISVIRPNPNSWVSYANTISGYEYYLITGHGTSYNSNFPYLNLARPDGVVPTSSDYGLQIFNESGIKTFDSNVQYFVVRDVITITLSDAESARFNPSTGATPLIYKSHVYCQNPYYMVHNFRHIYAQYIYSSGGWSIYLYTTGIGYYNNTLISLSLGVMAKFNYVSDYSKSQIEQMIANNNANFPQYILVGEIK